MEGLKLSNGLKFKLGDETVANLAALKELDEKTAMLFATPENLTNEMMIPISRKTITLTKLLQSLNKINQKRISNEKKAAQMKAAIAEIIGPDVDVDRFIAELDSKVELANSEVSKKDVEEFSGRVEAEIEETENRIAEKNSELENVGADYQKAMELSEEIKALEEKLEVLYAEWETLSEEM